MKRCFMSLLPREGEKVAEGRMRGCGADLGSASTPRFFLPDSPSSVGFADTFSPSRRRRAGVSNG
jgi:hypothetical protein